MKTSSMTLLIKNKILTVLFYHSPINVYYVYLCILWLQSDKICISLSRVMTPIYQHILALEFAIKEINRNLHLLPNHTLGFQIYNTYFMTSWTYQASLELFSRKGQFLPNYNCETQHRPIAVIGGPTADVCVHMSAILSLYKMPQVSPLMEPRTNR